MLLPIILDAGEFVDTSHQGVNFMIVTAVNEKNGKVCLLLKCTNHGQTQHGL